MSSKWKSNERKSHLTGSPVAKLKFFEKNAQKPYPDQKNARFAKSITGYTRGELPTAQKLSAAKG